MHSSLSPSRYKQNQQLPNLNLETIKKQNGFQKMKKPSYYGTTHQQIEITREQLYTNQISSPHHLKGLGRQSSESVGSNFGSSYNLTNNTYSPSNIKSPRIQEIVFQDSPQLIGKVKKSPNFSEILLDCTTNSSSNAISKSNSKQNSPKQNNMTEFFKNNELLIREIISLITNELNSHHSELKQYLNSYGMSGEIFTFYLNRFLELSCGKENQAQIFFKINDIIYHKTISLLQDKPQFKPILNKLDENKHLILPKTLMEQICTSDLLKQIIQKVYEEARNSTFMSEYFTSDKQINSESAIQILEDAFAGNYSELQEIVNSAFGKNKFTHIFFYFFKNSLQNVLKKQGIPKILIYKIIEKIESLRYILVEEHECLEYRDHLEKLVISTLSQDSLIKKIPRIGYLSPEQLQRFSKQMVKNLIFQPEIQVLRKHVTAIINDPALQVILIDSVCAALNQYLQKKDVVDESIHELALRKEKLLLSLELNCLLISDNNIIKELIDMVKKGVKKEKHMIDDLKILENPIMVQTYLESLNSPYNCTSIKDWSGAVQLSQVTSWQIGIWFRILKTSIIKQKLNHQTQFLIEQELNYIQNQQ